MVTRVLALVLVLVACFVWQSESRASTSPAAAMSECAAWKASATPAAGFSNVGSCTDLGPLASPGVTGTAGCNGTPNAAGTGYVCIAYHSNYGGSDQHSTWSYPNPGCPAGQTYSTVSHSCANPCNATDAPLGSTWVPDSAYPPNSPDLHVDVCSGGCQYLNPDESNHYNQITGDGQHWTDTTGWVPVGQTCSVAGGNQGSTPPADTDGDGVSDGQDGAPNNPGSTGANPPPTPPPAGTCGGVGQPKCPDATDPSNHQSTGGGDCNTPPQSSGDPILGQIAFQTWATRCALTGKANTGGSTGGGTVVGGTDMTATNGKLDGIKEGIDKLGNTDGMTTLDHSGEDGTGTVAEVDGGLGSNGFDQSGFGFSRSCPAPPTVEVFGTTLTLAGPALCDWMIAGSYFVLLLAGIGCARIIASA